MIGECNRQKHSRRALRLNISSVDIRGACCFRASCVHNVLAVKFAMRHCKQCVSNEASKRSRGPVRNWDVNFSSFRMCLPWHVPTALIVLSLSISFSLSFLAPTRFFNFFFFFPLSSRYVSFERTRYPRCKRESLHVLFGSSCICVWKIKWIDACYVCCVFIIRRQM